ncbi:MAG: hypothetical protein IKQ46_04595, partial [Bacteroidales bacterium]|nr:hypothetical protein [Bacteroidales bacterium]
PKELQERVFEKLFRQAEIAMFTPKEYLDYEESLHNLWDITNAMNDAETKGFGKGKEEGLQQGLQQGRAEGRTEGIKETAKRMKAKGFDIQTIADLTQLSVDEIEKL